jgi:(R,R)-butanediol dehydrogenase / meso-butanediol dehydrogenase / diacetyl reductase
MIAAYYVGNRSFNLDTCDVVAPGRGEVRLNVAYCGVCGTDLHIFHGAMDKRVSTPQVIGHEMSGTVAETGEGVTEFEVGDSVVVRPLDNRAETKSDRGFGHICRGLKFIGIDSPGAFQASWTVPAFTVHKLSPDVDLKLAALAEPLAVACHDVRMAGLRPDELAVVIGGGPIGILIALVARHRGARIVLTEVAPFRLQFARELGLDAFNPKETDVMACIQERSNGSGADVVFEVSGAKAALLNATEFLAIRGRLLLVAIYPQPVEVNLFHFFWKELRLQGARVYEREDYERAIELISTNALPLQRMVTSVVPLEGIQQAFNTLESDPQAMKVLIDCHGEPVGRSSSI